MGVENVSHHLRESVWSNKPFSCATACLYAILPFEPCEETEEAFYHNIGNMLHYSALIREEFMNHSIFVKTHFQKQYESPSQFFSRIYRATRASAQEEFRGGLRSTDILGTPHVIAVLAIHKDRKATILDIAPYNAPMRSLTPYVKKVPLAALDRRVRPTNAFPASLAYTTFPEMEKYSRPNAPYYEQSLVIQLQEKSREAANHALRLSHEMCEINDLWKIAIPGTKRKRRLARKMRLTRNQSE